jgi:hypothetical protein
MFLNKNGDDDDGNGVLDLHDTDPLRNQDGEKLNDNDLEQGEFSFHIYLAGMPGGPLDGDGDGDIDGYTATLSVSGGVKLWDSQSKEHDITGETRELPMNGGNVPFYVEGVQPGAATIKFELTAPDGNVLRSDEVKLTVVNVDLDTDSDNSGAIDGTLTEDLEEEQAPGRILWQNYDDDNGNNAPDQNENPVLNENNLRPVTLTFDAGNADLSGYGLELIAADNLELWDSPSKNNLVPLTYTIGANGIQPPLPTIVYVEGLKLENQPIGQGGIQFRLIGGQASTTPGQVLAEDRALFTVVYADLTAYRPQTEGAGYGNPFPRTAVPAGQQVGIRRNGDDDDGDNLDDLSPTDTSVAGENDLIEVKLHMPPLPGVEYRLESANGSANIAAWGLSSKQNSLSIDGSATISPTQGDDGTIWLEWIGAATAGATANLRLQVRDAVHGHDAFYSPLLTFYPFTSVVVALGGEGQDAPSPGNPDPNIGTFYTAQELYNDGYDVHFFNEDAVNSLGIGTAYDEVVSAVQERGVTEVAVFGYSHGGGSTYSLSDRLNRNIVPASDPWQLDDITLPFIIAYTAYIDAVSNSSGIATEPEDRRPPGTQWHLNVFQTIYWLNGADMGADADRQINVSTDDDTANSNADWDSTDDHYEIDDDELVRDVLEDTLKGHVER